jgi:hypothetical protein
VTASRGRSARKSSTGRAGAATCGVEAAGARRTKRRWRHSTWPVARMVKVLTPKFGKESDLWVRLDEESVWWKE